MKSIAIALAILFAAAAPSHADTPWAQGVSKATQDQANKLFDEANTLFAQQSHTAALEKYKAAIALWDHPLIRYNMAVTLIRLERFLEASDALEKALRFGDAPFNKDLYQQVLTNQSLLKASVGFIDSTCDKKGAHVLLDGKPWYDCPGNKKERVLAGEHAVIGELQGYLTSSQKIVVAGGTTATSKVNLVPLDSAVALKYPHPRWESWTVAAGGLAIALGGVGVWLNGKSTMDNFEADFARQCANGCPSALDSPDLASLARERSSAELQGKIGIGLMIGGGAVAVTGVVMTIMNRPRRVMPNIEVMPQPGGMAASYSGHF